MLPYKMFQCKLYIGNIQTNLNQSGKCYIKEKLFLLDTELKLSKILKCCELTMYIIYFLLIITFKLERTVNQTVTISWSKMQSVS